MSVSEAINKEPLVTVVTITFNLKKAKRQKYFRQCLESVHRQSYPNIEHLVIDGASTDGTKSLLNEYQRKKWIEYISEPDKGVYDAMNKGIALAKGKYICFLNSDDFFCSNDAVADSVALLEVAGADYSYADTQGIDCKNDNPVGIWRGSVARIPFGNHYCHQSMFTKTTTLKELGGFNLSYKVSADSDLMVKLVARGKKSVHLPKVIVAYRTGGVIKSTH